MCVQKRGGLPHHKNQNVDEQSAVRGNAHRGRIVNGMHKDMQSPAQSSTPVGRRWRRAVVTSSVLFGLVAAGLTIAPAVLTRTSLRNQMLVSTFDRFGVTATAQDADGGWVHPLSFQDLELQDNQGRVIGRIKEIQTSMGLLGFLQGRTDIGELRLVEPSIEIFVNEDGTWPFEPPAGSSPINLDFRIENASLRINVPWRKIPIVEAGHLDLSGSIAADETGQRTLTIEPFQVFDHMTLSDKHAEQNLALIAPVLSQSAKISGSASVRIDRIRIPLDPEDGRLNPFPIHGRAEFHSLEAHLKSAWVRQIMMITGQMANASLPDRIEIARESFVDFSVSADGIYHDGMTFLLPEITSELTVRSSGTVKLDESLDLSLAISLPVPNPAEVAAHVEAPTAAARPIVGVLTQLLKEPVTVSVTGTVSNPVLGAPAGSDLLTELSKRIAPEQHSDQPPAVSQAVFQLIQGVSQPNKDEAGRQVPGGILNLIRSIKSEAEKSGRTKADKTKDRPPRPRK